MTKWTKRKGKKILNDVIFSFGNEKYLLIVVEGNLFTESKICESIRAKK